MRRLGSALLLGWLLAGSAWSQAPAPPKPAEYVTDRAGILAAPTISELNRQLAEFERATSSQVVVWIEKKVPADAALDEYVNRLFQAWKIGQAGRDNGVLLAIFPDDRRMRIETGYGLEGALPDALAGRIIANDIGPRFKAGDYNGGVTAGVKAIMAAVRGEYRGTGRTRAEHRGRPVNGTWALMGAVIGLAAGAVVRRSRFAGAGAMEQVGQALWGGIAGGIGHGIAGALLSSRLVIPAAVVMAFTWMFIVVRQRGEELSGRGRRRRYGGWNNWGSGWNSGGWGGGSGGGGGGGFGGGFSGGGGSSGGGGASGGW